jgi:hypothetical protein
MHFIDLIGMDHSTKCQIENGSAHWNGLPSAVQWATVKL